MNAVYFRVLALVTALSVLPLNVTNLPQPSNWPAILNSTVTGEPIGPGVNYARWKLATSAGPLELSIATIDLHNPYVAFRVASHGDGVVGPGERLTSMADRLGAELGVNADYFDINDTNAPLNILVTDGRLLHQPDSAAAFAVDSHNAVYMGAVQWHASLHSAANAQFDLERVNEWSPSTDLAEVTPEFGTQKALGATELVLTAASGPADAYTVSRIDRDLTTLEQLSPTEIGIVGHGGQADSLAADFRLGDTVSITTQSRPSISSLKMAIGGGPLLVSGGQIVNDPSAPAPEETNLRNPVTGAGVSRDGATLWLVVVDGRAPNQSIGLTRPQFAALFIALGASTAMAFDSGGSSEMVVRRLGDTRTSVATIPSDGRERSLADGLFVTNVAPVGPATQLLLEPSHPTPDILAGSKLAIEAHAIDANDQPVTLLPGSVAFSSDPTALATIDRDGVVSALQPGSLRIHAASGEEAADLDTSIVASADVVRIVGADEPVPSGGEVKLSLDARTKDGTPIVFDPALVTWSLESGPGEMRADGTFVASPLAARDVVGARLGSASASAILLTGDHTQVVQAIPVPGANSGQWSYASRPSGMAGGVDGTAAPDGGAALRLAYDFSSDQNITKAAYAKTTLTVAGQPIALSVDVYGDANGEWLRGGYRNFDGNSESVTIARHVAWQGWRTLRVEIPRQAAWPITWTSLYAVEPDKQAREQGSVWFRNLGFAYAGPILSHACWYRR
jgi:Phosphodiester glycosidase